MRDMKKKQDYDQEYKRQHYKRIIALIPKSDEDVLKRIEENKPTSAYIYKLIKQDIEKKSGK